MTTSGQTSFGYGTQNDDLILEAFERIGQDGSTLTPVRTISALRSLNLMFTDWANKGPNLFAVEQLDIQLVIGTASYSLPQDTVDTLQVLIEQPNAGGTQDLIITRISRAEWFALPNKTQTGDRPTQYYLERTVIPVMYLWPVPANAWVLKYYRMRMLQNIGQLTQTPDVANRWLEAICAGLAMRLAVKYAPDRLQVLTPLADAAYQTAAAEDAERVTLRIVPDNSAYYM
jgi:hypothetical protein